MKSYLRSLAAFVLALLLILHSLPSQAQASRVVLAKAHSSSVASQTVKDLHTKKKDPFKKLDSSSRMIPPSTSNPTQNK
ncbi:hypothetical protein ACSBR2_043152 [Camellia fascicularis]